MRKALPLSLAIALISNGSYAADAACSAQQQALNGVGDKYKSQFDDEQREGNEIKDSAVNFNFTITWDNVDIVFGVPVVTLTDRTIILGLPQVTVKTQEIIFGTPSVRMERRQTGIYPEFTCDHSFIPKCTVTWSPSYMDVPVPFLQEQHIKMGIPEFTFEDTKIIFGVPEFSLKQQHWIVGLPQFRLDSVYINSGALKDRSDALQKRIGSTRSALVSDTLSSMHSLYDCERGDVTSQREKAIAQFNSGVNILDAVIQSIRSQGGDPTKMPDGSDLVAKRASLDGQRVAVLASFDDALAKLDASERGAVSSMGGGSAPTVISTQQTGKAPPVAMFAPAAAAPLTDLGGAAAMKQF